MDLRLFATLLGVALIVLRLAGVINWHWFLVLFPFWPAMILLLIAALAWTIIGLVWLLSNEEQRKRAKARRELREIRRFLGLRSRLA